MRSRCRSKDGAQGPDQVSALTYRHTLQAQPGRHAHQLLGQRSGDADRVSALFGKGSDDIERAGRAIGLEVDPAHQLPIEQERPHVVAVLPFGRGCVDLDAVVEIEKPLDARTKKISGSKGHSSAVPGRLAESSVRQPDMPVHPTRRRTLSRPRPRRRAQRVRV